nr:MAG TPA: baseplate protein [Caudoviricetes sp.]
MPNEPLSTQNYVQIGDKVLNRTADASITTNDVSLSDRIFVFKRNEDGSIKTVVNTTIQYIVDAFSADATAIKNSTKEYCDGIKADTSQLKADTEALKNAAVTAKTSAESARDSAISAKNSASTSATNASSSEAMAKKWASNPVGSIVADSKYSAYHYAVNASTSARTATTKASEASASASSASTSASNASSSASSASASATSASSSASTASTKASEASTSANQAKEYRDETQQLSSQFNPASILLSVYPVGSIYMSVNSTDPSSLFGGGWTRLKDRFLLAAGNKYAGGSEGGSDTHSHTTATHTLTENEMPKHTHKLKANTETGAYLPTGSLKLESVVTNSDYSSRSGTICDRYQYVTAADTINIETGGGASHSHGDTGSASSMPPYLAVYVWKRIS